MSEAVLRFIHASDFHLEWAARGVAELPDHLATTLIEAPYRAARRVFDAALAEQVDFVVLSGDLLDPATTGPRGPLFLVEQFNRLAEQEIPVYWATGRVDHPSAWPSGVEPPANVHRFAVEQPESVLFERSERPSVELIGVSRDRGSAIAVESFHVQRPALFSIGVVHGMIDAEALAGGSIDYWALGGRHNRQTLADAPPMVHDPGSPQGRSPSECGPHGCTLVEAVVEAADRGKIRTRFIATDVVRWHEEQITLNAADTREGFEALLRERIEALAERLPEIDVLIAWTISGVGDLPRQLRRGAATVGVLRWLRDDYGRRRPSLWSASLRAEAEASPPREWSEEDSLLGEFLRAVRATDETDEPIDLGEYLRPDESSEMLTEAARIADPRRRRRILAEAASLGVDLLRAEEPEP